MVDIGDLQGWHILEAGVSLVREGRKIEVATDVDKLGISERTAGVSSQGEEEMGLKDVMEKVVGGADCGFMKLKRWFYENKEIF